MRVLNFSLDKEVLKEGSLVARRLAALSVAAGEVVVLVPSGKGSKLMQFLRLWQDAKKILSEKQFDLITVQDTAYLALLAYLLALKFRVPFEVQVHGFERFSGTRKVLAGFVLRRADKIRVVSERLQRELETRFKIQDSRIYELPVYVQGMPPTTPTPLASLGVLPLGKGGEEEKLFTFLTVGRLVPIKNITMQIRAFARIAKEFSNVRLVIVGDGPERENLPKHDRVIFEGTQKELSRFYENADAFLLTSDSEGWGVVVTEAAAYGVPIIMTDVGCAGEFITDGENGIVIPVGDEDALVCAMRNIITDGELRARLGRGGRASFLALPTSEEHIQKQIAEWQKLN